MPAALGLSEFRGASRTPPPTRPRRGAARRPAPGRGALRADPAQEQLRDGGPHDRWRRPRRRRGRRASRRRPAPGGEERAAEGAESEEQRRAAGAPLSCDPDRPADERPPRVRLPSGQGAGHRCSAPWLTGTRPQAHLTAPARCVARDRRQDRAATATAGPSGTAPATTHHRRRLACGGAVPRLRTRTARNRCATPATPPSAGRGSAAAGTTPGWWGAPPRAGRPEAGPPGALPSVAT